LFIDEGIRIMNINKIYQKIAKENGVTAAEVEREIQAAISAVYSDPQYNNAITKANQDKVTRRGEIPTAEELIHYVAQKVKEKK
jgi:Sporulation initiation factor Spo0A C terminal.